MSVPFVNHHVHSHFSPLDGLSKPQDIVERVVEMGQTSVSITDHGYMSGIPQMYAAAKEAGIGFTPGIEAYFTTDRKYRGRDRNGENYYHLLMLATSDKGYKNLVKMQTPAWEEGYYFHPRVDYELLDQYSEGIVVTTSCLSGIVSRLLLNGKYKEALEETATLVDIYGKENVFVEIQRHGIPDQEKILGDQVKIAKDLGLELLATTDSHYTRKGDHDVHDTLLCCSAGGNKFLSGNERFKFDSTKNYLQTGEEMLEVFPERDFPRAVTNTYELAQRTEKSDFSLPMGEGKYILPTVKVEEGKNEMDTLRSKVYEGARDINRYGDNEGNISQEIKDRIEYELGVIENMGFPGYFLIVANYVQMFKDNGIEVGHGRGCLHENTKVLTDSGWKKIPNVKINDYVIDATGKKARVIDTKEHQTYDGEELVQLISNNGESISLTEKHRVLSVDKNGDGKWIPAARIKPGDSIVHVTGSHKNDFEYFDGQKSGKKNDALRSRIVKNIDWGYVAAMLVIHADIDQDLKIATWNFTKDNQDIAQTFIHFADRIFENKISVEKEKDYITKITLKNHDCIPWAIDKRLNKDMFIGVGSKDYSYGFLFALQLSFSDPRCYSTTIIKTDSEEVAEIVRNTVTSAGMSSYKEGNTIKIESLKGYGTRKISTVISTEKIQTSKNQKVYDLTIEGHPSFLTDFGTVHNSAPGSVVVYCLGITNIDPMEHNLFFERFLNPDRISMPDIDIDIPKTKRGRALQLLEEEYGHGHVAQISNYSAMKQKDALERIAKAYGMTPGDAGKFKSEVEKYLEGSSITLKDLVEQEVIPQSISKAAGKNKYAWEILKDASIIDGTFSGYNTHACGIVITTNRVDEYFPIRYKIEKGSPVGLPICQYDGHDVEALGGVKMDLLGLINLDQASDAERNILLDLGEKIDSTNIPLDDKETYKLLSRGSGGGVFQLGCLSGDTIVEGKKIKHWYQLRNSTQRASTLRSVFLGEGHVNRNSVLDVVYSGKKNTISIEIENGNSLICTPEHHIFTTSGWKKADDLTTEDHVLIVDDNVGKKGFLQTIRGRTDILDMFEQIEKDWVRVDFSTPIAENGVTFYPSFHKYGALDDLVLIYPDENREDALSAFEAFNAVEGKTLAIYSYSEVAERFYAETNVDEDYLTPIGTRFSKVTEIKENGIIDTYDFMMKPPVNNFIANGIMVHNSSGIKELMREMKPTEFNDISALLALYRPGPMGMETHHEYARRKNNLEPIKVFHKDAKDVLKDTYGLTVYQENIMAISQKFAGYTGAEADELRKAVGKKIPEMMEAQKKKFIPAVDKRYHKGLGQQIWDIIEPFGSYAFNLSHSAAYGMLSYRTAWLKTHYAPQFAGACIDYTLNDKDKRMATIVWIREEGINILNPDVNVSETRTVTNEDSIVLPLDIINGLGESQAEAIINERNKNGEYTSVVDFVARNKVSANTVINIAKSGGFDCFGYPRVNIVEHIGEIMSAASVKKSRYTVMEDSLFGDLVEDSDDEDNIDLDNEIKTVVENNKIVDVDDDLYAHWEREALGFILGPHPFKTIRELKSSKTIFKSYPPIDTANRVTPWKEEDSYSGIITNITNRIAKSSGNPYCKFDLETDSGSVECVMFKKNINESWEGSFVIVKGAVKNDAESSFRSSNDDTAEGENAKTIFIPSMICNDMKRISVAKLKAKG